MTDFIEDIKDEINKFNVGYKKLTLEEFKRQKKGTGTTIPYLLSIGIFETINKNTITFKKNVNLFIIKIRKEMSELIELNTKYQKDKDKLMKSVSERLNALYFLNELINQEIKQIKKSNICPVCKSPFTNYEEIGNQRIYYHGWKICRLEKNKHEMNKWCIQKDDGEWQ